MGKFASCSWAVALAALSWSAVPANAQSEVADSLVGSWTFRNNDSDGVVRALSLSEGGDAVMWVGSPGDRVYYTSGRWQVEATPNGAIHMTLNLGTSILLGWDGYEPYTFTQDIRLEGPDFGQVWRDGETSPWGTMERTSCDLGMRYRDITDTPPVGCRYAPLRDVGFSGLEGECRWFDEDLPKKDGSGVLFPMDCLTSVPAN